MSSSNFEKLSSIGLPGEIVRAVRISPADPG